MINTTPSKLFKLKKWLTLPETAKHLSMISGEDISEVEVRYHQEVLKRSKRAITTASPVTARNKTDSVKF